MATHAPDDASNLTEELASSLHDKWRATRLLPDGTYEPHWKDDGHGDQVDIANTNYFALPSQYQEENRASAYSAVKALKETERLGQVDEQGNPDIDFMSDIIHNDWLKRNESYATNIQKLPYVQLPEEEKEKDRIFARTAVERRDKSENRKPQVDSTGLRNTNKNESSKGLESTQSSATKAGKKLAGKALQGKGASKIAGGTNTSPTKNMASGVKDAGKAIKNKDGMGVADAAVKTGAVAAATTYGGTLGGVAASKVLETKTGRKLTRFVSWGIVVTIIAPLMGLLLMMTAILGIFAAVDASFRGSGQGPGAVIECASRTATALTDSSSVANFTTIIQDAAKNNRTVGDAIMGIMVFMTLISNPSSVSTDPIANASNPDAFANAFYDKLNKSGLGKNITISNPWTVAQHIVGLKPSEESNYAGNYEVAYLSTLDILGKKGNEALSKQINPLNEATKDWRNSVPTPTASPSPSASSTVSQTSAPVALPLCDITSAFDEYGNFIDSGSFVFTVADGPPLPAKYEKKLQATLARASSYVGNPPAGCNDRILNKDGTIAKPALCVGQCDQLASFIWGYGWSGYQDAGVHWDNVKRLGYTHSDDTNPPVGALLFWGPRGGSVGHVAVYVGGGYVVSNWYENTNPGVWRILVGEVAKDGYKYLGWSEPIFQKLA
jgi:hypothetical protein